MPGISLTSGMQNNLTSLQATVELMNRTQDRLATGKKVNSALDSPVSFFAAQRLTERASDLTALKDSMGQAIQTIKAADSGIKGITALIESAKSIAQAALASSDATTRAGFAAQFDTLRTQIGTLAADSGYQGTNLINGNSLTVNFNEAGTNTLTVTGSAAGAGLTLTASVGSWAATGDINASITELTAASASLRNTSASLSSNLAAVNTRLSFTNDMVNTLTSGADKLVLADMNEEGANMLMLQTRQALATTGLSLASQAAQSVLRLF